MGDETDGRRTKIWKLGLWRASANTSKHAFHFRGSSCLVRLFFVFPGIHWSPQNHHDKEGILLYSNQFSKGLISKCKPAWAKNVALVEKFCLKVLNVNVNNFTMQMIIILYLLKFLDNKKLWFRTQLGLQILSWIRNFKKAALKKC